MGKRLLYLLVLVACLGMTACGKDTEDVLFPSEPSTSSLQSSVAQSKVEGIVPENKPEAVVQDKEEFPGTVRVNLSDVQYCIGSPKLLYYGTGTGNWVRMDSYSVVYDNYVNPASELIYNVDLTKITEASNVIDGLKEQFLSSCSEALILADEYSYVIEKQENVKINEWDMCKVEGTINLYSQWAEKNPDYLDYYAAKFSGYSLIKDGCPVYFVVIENPLSEEKADLAAIAEKIAKTFREYSQND